MSDELNILNRRMSAIERENRRLKAVLGVFAVLALIPIVVGAAAQQAATAEVVRATRFEVVQNGKVVASMSAATNGGSVDVFDAAGARAGFLRSTQLGGSLDISKAGKSVGYFGALERGGGWLCVANASNQCVVTAGSNNQNNGQLMLGWGDGKASVDIYSDVNGGNVNLMHHFGSGTAGVSGPYVRAINMHPGDGFSQSARITIFSSIVREKIAATLGATLGGNGRLEVYDDNGNIVRTVQ